MHIIWSTWVEAHIVFEDFEVSLVDLNIFITLFACVLEHGQICITCLQQKLSDSNLILISWVYANNINVINFLLSMIQL